MKNYIALLMILMVSIGSVGAQDFIPDPRKPQQEEQEELTEENATKGKYGGYVLNEIGLVQSSLLPERTLLQQRDYGIDLFIAGMTLFVAGGVVNGLNPTGLFTYDADTYLAIYIMGSATAATGLGMWIAGAHYWNNANYEMRDLEVFYTQSEQRATQPQPGITQSQPSIIQSQPSVVLSGNLVRGKYGEPVDANIGLLRSRLLPNRTLLQQRDYGIDLFIAGMVLWVSGSVVTGLSPLAYEYRSSSFSSFSSGYSYAGPAAISMYTIGSATAATGLGMWIAGAVYWGNANGQIQEATWRNRFQSRKQKKPPVDVVFTGTGLYVRY